MKSGLEKKKSSFLLYFESELFPTSELSFNPLKTQSYVESKVYSSFLKENNNTLRERYLKSLREIYSDCELIDFGKLTMHFDHKYAVIYLVFKTQEIDLELTHNYFFNLKALRKKAKVILDHLYKSIEITVVKREITRYFLPEHLKDTIRRTFEKEAKSSKVYYQYYERYPNLIEFHTNVVFDTNERITQKINEFYKTFFPIIEEEMITSSQECNFYFMNLLEEEKHSKRELARTFSRSLIDYIKNLYSNIISNLDFYRNKIKSFSEDLVNIPVRTLIEIKDLLSELQRRIFEVEPLIYIPVVDKYILYGYNDENPDLTLELFSPITPDVNTFRRKLILLKDTVSSIISEIKGFLRDHPNRITTFTKQELIMKLNSIETEQEFRTEVLIPILEDLGYNNVQEYHGIHEYGVDILFSSVNKIGIMEWNGVVVKKGNINQDIGTELSQKLKGIFKQVYQVKTMEHLEKNYGHVDITRVFIATNGKINYQAKKALKEKDPLIKGNVFFIDSDTLKTLI